MNSTIANQAIRMTNMTKKGTEFSNFLTPISLQPDGDISNLDCLI